MPHNKTLFQLGSFWATVLLPLICAGIVWFLIFKSLGYPDLVATYDGFNRAYEYFKIPLWIAALSLPLAGFYATNHRSVQTVAQIARTDLQIARSDRQIAATESKNTFENHIKHMDHFQDSIKRLGEIHGIEIGDPVSFYRRIFPSNDYSSFSPWADDMEFVEVGYDIHGGDDIFHRNYIMYVRSHMKKIISSDSLLESLDSDAFIYFELILRKLFISKINGVTIRSNEDMETYFSIDGYPYIPVFKSSLGAISDFFFSLQSICLSKKMLDGLSECDGLDKSSVSHFRITLKEGHQSLISDTLKYNDGAVSENASRAEMSLMRQQKWREQTAQFRAKE